MEMLELGYQQSLEQKQILSQKMIQSAEILQMDVQELEEYIQKQALENPLIDLEEMEKGISGFLYGNEKNETNENEDLKRKLEWLNHADEQNRLYYAQEYEESEEKTPWNFAMEENSLEDYLMSQLIMIADTEEDRKCLEFLVCSLDSKGYLKEDTWALAQELKISHSRLMQYIKILQSVEPAGVGAQNAGQCLMIQLERMRDGGLIEEELFGQVSKLVEQHLEELGKHRFVQVAEQMGITVEQVDLCYRMIQKLNPIPGNSFSSREKLRYIKPDVTVVKFEDYFEILVNDLNTPRITFNRYYLRMMNQDSSREVQEYIKNKYHQAQWMQHCVEERGNTLRKVTREIVAIQHEFFENPNGKRVPMNLLTIAERLEIHESTVSRAIRNKFLQCSRGVFPINYFFVKGVAGASESPVTPEDVKQKIMEVIEHENKRKPLSDQKISDQLKAAGIEISRRTIAKYRGELMIADASGRKEFV